MTKTKAFPLFPVLLVSLFCKAGEFAFAAPPDKPTESRTKQLPLEKTTFDLVVSSATPAGICAAIAASQSGLDVLLIEESNHVGGIIAGGLTNADIITRDAVGGLFNVYQQRIRDYYIDAYGKDSDQYKKCRGGIHVEPSVAEFIFDSMLREHSVRVLKGYRIVGALIETESGGEEAAPRGRRFDEAGPEQFSPPRKLKAVVIQKTDRSEKTAAASVSQNQGTNVQNENLPPKITVRAQVFIDAGYEGDFAALSGADYRVGRESRETFNERLAGNIYVPFGTLDIHPDSTGKGDRGIQAFCFRFFVTDDPATMISFKKPEHYNREDYRPVLNDIKSGKLTRLEQAIQFFPMPNGKYETNSNHPDPRSGVPSESFDLAEENWNWPEAAPDERAVIFKRYWDYSEGLIWFFQNDPEVPEEIRQSAQKYGLCANEFTDHDFRPHHIYVRQGRRIWGEYNFTENDTNSDPRTGLPEGKPDAVAIAEFPLDSHGVTKYDPSHPGVREGYFYVEHAPAQIPFRICVPKSVDALLVPVACSATHVGYQTLRVEPTFMAIGEACGIAAAESIRQQKSLREMEILPVQKEIVKRKGVICYDKRSKTK